MNMKNMTTPMPLADYPFKGKYLECQDGARMHYLDEGNGPVVILLHGNPTWSYMWRNLINKYKNQWRFIAPDHIGMGYSDRSPDLEYRLENHVKRLHELLLHLNIKNYRVVAHDWGGAIAMGLAVLEKCTPKCAIMMNTAAFCDINIPWTINLCRTPYLGEWLMRGANGFAWPATWMTTVQKMPKVVKAGMLAPYGNWQNRIGIARFVQDIPMSQKHPTWPVMKKIEDQLSTLACPMQLIWGMQDFCFTPHFLSRWQKLFPKAKVKTYQDAGHYLLEDKQEIVEEINTFLTEQEH